MAKDFSRQFLISVNQVMAVLRSFQWEKLGQLYKPKALCEKLQTHAANPLAIHLQDDVYRIFFSGRDAQNRSSVGFVDIDILTQSIQYMNPQPVFEYGAADSFFVHGVSIGCAHYVGGKTLILFMGWQCPPSEHWRGDIGVLLMENNNSMVLQSSVPYLSTDEIDPLSLSYPWVVKQPDNSFMMYYGSTLSWESPNGEMIHVINQASSSDGINWVKHGLAIPYSLGEAQAFSRPTVFVDKHGHHHMWFSYRSGLGTQYRIGYASSFDGRSWELALHQAGIDVANSGWDSEMIEYPFIFTHKGQIYMLYNGNGYGKTGFGLARLQTKSPLR